MNDIFKNRPYPKWGFDNELGCSNDMEDDFVVKYFKRRSCSKYVVDLGAADGITGSNSYKLINNFGWNAVLVEPLKPFYNYLLELYKDNNNVEILNYACDIEEKETEIKYRSFDEAIGLSSLVLNWENSQKIESKKFNTLVKQKRIDFLSIDCEGKDFDIIKDINFDEYDIEIICCERSNNDYDYNKNISDYLIEKDYILAKITNHNFIFVKI
jgi:FkbM family methyltransferase